MPSFPITAATKLRTPSKQAHLTVTETEGGKQLPLPVMIVLSAAQVLLCCLAWVFSLFLFKHKSLCLHRRHISPTPGDNGRKPHLEVSFGRCSSLMKHNLYLHTTNITILISTYNCLTYPEVLEFSKTEVQTGALKVSF